MITEEYDYTDQEVYEMTCECPAYYSYNGETVRKLSQAVIREHQIEPPPKGAFHIYLYIEN